MLYLLGYSLCNTDLVSLCYVRVPNVLISHFLGCDAGDDLNPGGLVLGRCLRLLLDESAGKSETYLKNKASNSVGSKHVEVALAHSVAHARTHTQTRSRGN